MSRKMKDSGIDWIGEIPEGWETCLYKYCCSVQPGYPFDSAKFSNSSTDGFPLIRIRDITSGEIQTYYTGEYPPNYIVTAGDLLVGMDGDFNVRWWNNDAALLNQRCCRVTEKNSVLRRFLYYVLPFTLQNINTLTYATTVKHLANGDILNSFIAFPSLPAQQNIVHYLDTVCSEIDAILSKTRSSIEEYKKLKQAVITQAVTKGVRGEREMKDSGVEWIGEIPKEWRKTQLRHCATIKSGITLGKSYSKDTVLIERPYLRVANVQGGYVDLNDLASIEVTPDEDLKYRLHSGDVLMTEGGDRDKLGRGCVWHGEIEPCLHQNHVFAVQTNESILLPEFLEYLTASDVGRSYFDITAIKTTNLACTSSSKVLAFTIPLPPVEEQIEIVSFIKKRSLELNKLIMKKELLVQELESYKKSLIYEVVTGKREV